MKIYRTTRYVVVFYTSCASGKKHRIRYWFSSKQCSKPIQSPSKCFIFNDKGPGGEEKIIYLAVQDEEEEEEEEEELEVRRLSRRAAAGIRSKFLAKRPQSGGHPFWKNWITCEKPSENHGRTSCIYDLVRKMLHFGKIPKHFGYFWRKFSKILAKFLLNK